MWAADNGDYEPNAHDSGHDISDYAESLHTDEAEHHAFLWYEQAGGYQQAGNDKGEADPVGTLVQGVDEIIEVFVLYAHLELTRRRASDRKRTWLRP